MKSDANKSRKQRQPAGTKAKPVCGTLSYLAECRGMAQKAPSLKRGAPPEIVDRIVRKLPAVL